MGAVTVGVADPETVDEWAAYLAVMPVGAESAAMLPVLQAGRLSGAGRIDALRAFERHAEWIQAQQVRVLAILEADPVASIPGRPDERADFETTVEQVACALRLSHTSAASRLYDARRLVGVFERTLGLLEEGKIHYMQAHAVVDTTANCTDEAARRVESLVLPLMPEQAVSATRKALRRAVFKADPEGAEQRHQRAREDRSVSHSEAEDGMAWWNAYVPAEDAARMDVAVDTHAEVIKGEGDSRTLGQRRADALVDLVVRGARGGGDLVQLGRTASVGRSAPVVQVTVGFDSLIGVSDDPAELKGYGPITAGQARALAFEPGSVWRRLLVEPGTGQLVKTDPRTYKPTAEVERHVVARDRQCQFPSCQMPAQRCDLDHVQRFDHAHPEAGGQTVPGNLVALCRRHHGLKHRTGWSIERDTTTGLVTWTAPTGHRYTSQPYNYAA